MDNAHEKLQQLLKELFQVESAADLDFGIYRIMKYKRAEVVAFIDKRLPEIVNEALEGGALARLSAQVEERRQVTDQIRENFGEYAIGPSGELNEAFHATPLGKRYLVLPPEAPETGSEQLDVSIFNHLYTFFSRYYDQGDFLSKRRYSRRQKYAVPYNGEEVYLHWANSDQYYIKTGSYFLNYSYEAPNGITVRFQVVTADLAHDNVQESDRRFVPRLDETVYDAEAKTFTVLFDWRPLTEAEKGLGKKQTEVEARSVNALLDRFEKEHDAHYALEVKRDEDSEGKPVGHLQYHLRRYTAKNTSDFFVHKDLKGFLERELDFYLKNEVLNVDNLERWMESGGAEFVAGRFETLRVIKQIGREIIAFLAQIENFQKKLFEKKKFVVSAGYCLTLDKVPRELYEEIAANEAQYEEWRELFHIDDIEDSLENGGEHSSVEWLEANPYLVLDTKFFDRDFEDRLLSSIEELDEKTDGLLISSENFQALNLLQERYREQVQCVYIDPPFNTDASPILYKNGYKSSSWASLMETRLHTAWPLMTLDGVLVAAIDDEQQRELSFILSRVSHERLLGTICVRTNPSGRPTQTGYSVSHEYLLFAGRGPNSHIRRLPPTKDQMARFSQRDEWGLFEWRNLRREGAGSDRDARRHLYYPIYIEGSSLRVPKMKWDATQEEWKVLEKPKQGESVAWPDNENGVQKRWRWGWTTVVDSMDSLAVRPDRSGRPYVYCKRRPHEEGVVSVSSWSDAKYSATEHGTAVIKALFGNTAFSYPKSIYAVVDSIYVGGASKHDTTVLDFFAGSGTTGHAVINLNREDGGKRKYILVEMEQYFDTILKPRIQKVIYSKDWKDGKPVTREGTSHIFKYMTLESYENSLNNVSFDSEGGEAALDLYGDKYRLHYMLDFETRDSETLLNVGEMAAPFDYKLTVRDASQKGTERRQLPVDLPETFAYLLGMRVQSRRAYHDDERRYLVYRGSTPERDDVAVIWRDTTGWEKEDYEGDRSFVAEKGMAEGAKDVFVNGDSLIPEARPLEATFKKLMLAGPASERH